MSLHEQCSSIAADSESWPDSLIRCWRIFDSDQISAQASRRSARNQMLPLYFSVMFFIRPSPQFSIRLGNKSLQDPRDALFPIYRSPHTPLLHNHRIFFKTWTTLPTKSSFYACTTDLFSWRKISDKENVEARLIKTHHPLRLGKRLDDHIVSLFLSDAWCLYFT